MTRSLRAFSGTGYDKGRPWVVQACWFAAMHLVFMKWWFPARLRPQLLRIFGAHVGKRVLIRHNVRVLWPWKLSIGDDSWIGEDAWLLNLENIVIGPDVCISQGAWLITGSHDASSPSFEYDNAAISVERGVWVAARATVLRGVTLAENSVVGAHAVVARNVAPDGFVPAVGTRSPRVT